MARSDKVPFRREFTLTENSYAGDENGLFVGDILSLHIDINKPSGMFFVEGKIGRSGSWEQVALGNNNEGIDIRAFEYIRIYVSGVSTSTTITIFGYPDNIIQQEVTVKATDNEVNRSIENNMLLCDIKDELKILNQYMSIITGDEIK